MKKISTLILSSSLLLSNVYAGVSVGGPVILGSVNQVHNTVHNNPDQLVINNQTQYATIVNYYSDNKIVGTLVGYPDSHFTLMTENGKMEGFIIVDKENDIAFKYRTNEKNEVTVEQVSVNTILCVSYKYAGTQNNAQTLNQTQMGAVPEQGPVPSYQSLAGSANVLYLDFDGFDLPAASQWNGGVALTAAAAGYSDAQIFETWSVTAEDYAPFNINVTTDVNVFNAAATGHRMRMVLTTTSSWSGGGGIAYVDVFTDATEKYQPGWVFVDKMGGSASNAGEATSHEAGHTLSLQHHGTLNAGVDTVEYYSGHGNWGPIMGAAYGMSMSQFSKGEYTNANSYYIDYQNNDARVDFVQDDLAEVAQRVAYKSDDHSNSIANSPTEISFTLNGSDGLVDSTGNNGLIGTTADLDAFHFYTGGGVVTLNFKPSAAVKSNLDIQVKLYNSSSTLVNTFSTAHGATTITGVSINQQLAADDYYLTIDGVGSGSAVIGWSDYNSMGPYYIKGTIPNAVNTTETKTLAGKNDVKIFPNPMNSDGILRFSTTVDLVKVYDVTGKILNYTNNSNYINLGNQLPEGVYFVELTANNQTVVSKVIR